MSKSVVGGRSAFMSQVPVDMYATLDIINSFTINVVENLNRFAAQCENKLARCTHNLNRLEVSLSLLESKLYSIDNLKENMEQWNREYDPNAPSAATTNTTTASGVPPPPPSSTFSTTGSVPPPPPSSSTVPPPPMSGTVPPPPPVGSFGVPPPPPVVSSGVPPPPPPSSSAGTPAVTSASPAQIATAATPAASQENIPTCEADPRLAYWFRLYTKVKVPKEQLAMKMRGEGLDPDILDTPNDPSPLGPYVEEQEKEEDNDSGSESTASDFSD